MDFDREKLLTIAAELSAMNIDPALCLELALRAERAGAGRIGPAVDSVFPPGDGLALMDLLRDTTVCMEPCWFDTWPGLAVRTCGPGILFSPRVIAALSFARNVTVESEVWTEWHERMAKTVLPGLARAFAFQDSKESRRADPAGLQRAKLRQSVEIHELEMMLADANNRLSRVKPEGAYERADDLTLAGLMKRKDFVRKLNEALDKTLLLAGRYSPTMVWRSSVDELTLSRLVMRVRDGESASAVAVSWRKSFGGLLVRGENALDSKLLAERSRKRAAKPVNARSPRK
jgi:hypothetical protein